MSTRIRYQKTETPNQLVSVRIYVIDGKDCQVYLNSQTYKFEVVDAASGQVYSEGNGVSLANVKLKAKKALEVFGITFDAESRSKN